MLSRELILVQKPWRNSLQKITHICPIQIWQFLSNLKYNCKTFFVTKQINLISFKLLKNMLIKSIGAEVQNPMQLATSITCIGKYNLIWLHNSSWMMFWVWRCVIMVIWRRETLWLQSATLVLGWKHDGSLEKRDPIFMTPVCNPGGSLMETLPTFGSYYWVQLNIFVGGPATTTLSFHYGNTSFVSL